MEVSQQCFLLILLLTFYATQQKSGQAIRLYLTETSSTTPGVHLCLCHKLTRAMCSFSRMRVHLAAQVQVVAQENYCGKQTGLDSMHHYATGDERKYSKCLAVLG